MIKQSDAEQVVTREKGRFMRKAKRPLRIFAFIASLITVFLVVYFLFTTPTNSGPWQPEYQHLASVEFSGDQVTIKNLRRGRYGSEGSTPIYNWTEKTVNLSDLKEVWFGISVFASPGLSHTFLSFDFGDDDPVVISVEARQRPDQHYSPLAGALDRYQLIYVIADEQDIVGVRTHIRKQDVFFQPLKLSKERALKLFQDMVARTNSLYETPAFYNTFTSNCTNSILRDTDISEFRRVFDPRILLPGFSDQVAYEFGVLDQNFTQEQLREAAHLNPETFDQDGPMFSTEIRASFYDNIEKIDN